jgi:signal peptidase I
MPRLHLRTIERPPKIDRDPLTLAWHSLDLPDRFSSIISWVWQRFWLAILLWLLYIYWAVNFQLWRFQPAEINVYFTQPLLWGALGLLAYSGWKFGVQDVEVGQRSVGPGIFLGVFQLSLTLLTGLIIGFGFSPYSHTPSAVIGNLIYVGTMLAGVEMSRAYLIMAISRKNLTLALLISAMLFTLVGVPLAQVSGLRGGEDVFRFAGEFFLPAFAENLLASFLVIVVGPGASFAYRGILSLFEWASPILPNIPWLVTAFVGTIAPITGMLFLWKQTEEDDPDLSRQHVEAKQSLVEWILVAMLAVSMLWFNTGFFGVRPTLVSGVSMEPALVAGDIVITSNLAQDSIEVGDVIRFKLGESYILHRVISIDRSTGGKVVFITQGDANNVPDRPLQMAQIDGKMIARLSKIGMLSIWLKELVQ